MTIFDLLFLVLFFAGVIALTAAGVLATRGHHVRALATLQRLAMAAAAYMSVVVVVSLLTPQRFIVVGEDQCSDDWCIAVRAVNRQSATAAVQYTVAFRLTSRAGRVAQRERSVVVYLRDSRGRRYDPDRDASVVPFDTLLAPRQTLEAVRRFSVPSDAQIVGLVVTREGGTPGPGCCIIGAEGSVFHKRTIVRLD
jgi:hypothetical protein